MSEWPRLRKAPIVEGLVDIRVNRRVPIAQAVLMSAAEELAAEFPSRQERRAFSGQIRFDAGANPSLAASDAPDGCLLRSADRRKVAQFTKDGCTISLLEPYSDWNELKVLSRRYWDHYRNATSPAAATRIALRFINRIPVPSGMPFDQVFQTTFQIAASLPQDVSGFLLRIAMPFESGQMRAIVSQMLEQDGLHCVFDIDVFSERPDGYGEEDLWQQAEAIRNLKNRLFFESITSAAMEQFK